MLQILMGDPISVSHLVKLSTVKIVVLQWTERTVSINSSILVDSNGNQPTGNGRTVISL